MPRRLSPLLTKNFHHVYNKGINGTETYLNPHNYNRFIDLINYYRFDKHTLRYSHYNLLVPENKLDYLASVQNQNNKLVNIHAFTLMPNHFHFLLEQLQEKGIEKFISKLINSYTKYFNAQEIHYGSIFLTQFKSKLIFENEIFLHVCRYIILNLSSSNIVKSVEELKTHPYTCFRDYLKEPRSFVETKRVLQNFNSIESFESFINDRASYQKELEIIKNLLGV